MLLLKRIPCTLDQIFEQDPLQILNAILPLYINGTLTMVKS